MTVWVPLSSIPRLDAIGRTARTRDGVMGTVLYFRANYVTIQTGSGLTTALVSEVEVMQRRSYGL